MDDLDKLAWYLYCQETAGTMDVRDFWDELSDSVKEIYRAKARDARCNFTSYDRRKL